MITGASRRLTALERRQPSKSRRVAIIGPDDPVPAGYDDVIRIVPAEFP